MWSFPTCEVCGEEIKVPHRYNIDRNVYVCPTCMSENMIKISRNVVQPIADAIWNVTQDWMEYNDPIFHDYDPDLGFGSFKEE